jgi:hypothetical protein
MTKVGLYAIGKSTTLESNKSLERSRGGRPRKRGRAIGIDEYARRKGQR